MADFLERLGIKRGTDTKSPQAKAEAKPLFGRKKKNAGAEVVTPTSPAPAKTVRWRKVEKPRAVVDPKLPDMSEAPQLVYELDADSLLAGGRRPMAISLLWQPRSVGQGLHAQAKAASVGDADFDLSVLFADGAQVGFASKLDAHKGGMIAAATAIPREFTGDTWLGAFVLSVSGEMLQLAWWIVAHRDGQVYEDRLIRNEVEARETFLDLYDAPGWQVVFGPANWQIAEAREVPLGYLIPVAAKGSKLKVHSPVRVWAPRAAAAAVVLGLLLGGYIYRQNELERIRLAEEERQRQILLAQQDALQVAPWIGMPGVSEAAVGCAALINATLVSPPGWVSDPITCTVQQGGLSVTTTWKRQPGTMAKFLYASLESEGLPKPQFDPALQTGSISLSAGIAGKEWGEGMTPLQPDEMFTRLVHRFDSLSLPLVLTAQIAAPPTDGEQIPNRKIWNYHSIELVSSTFVANQIELLGDIPAVVPQSITYDPAQQTWKLIANIYHPPIIQTS